MASKWRTISISNFIWFHLPKNEIYFPLSVILLDSIMANARLVYSKRRSKTSLLCVACVARVPNNIECEVCWLSNIIRFIEFQGRNLISYQLNSIMHLQLFLYRTEILLRFLSFLSMDMNMLNWSLSDIQYTIRFAFRFFFFAIFFLCVAFFRSIHCIDPIKRSYWWHCTPSTHISTETMNWREKRAIPIGVIRIWYTSTSISSDKYLWFLSMLCSFCCPALSTLHYIRTIWLLLVFTLFFFLHTFAIP